MRWARRAVLLAAVTVAPAAQAVDGDALGMSLASRLFAGEPHAVVVVDPTAYVGLDSGLFLFDVTDPSSWLALGHLYLPSPAFAVAIQGNLAYVASGESGLFIIDVADSSDPVVVGRLPTAGTRGVAVSGTTAYLAEADESPGSVHGLRTVDVSDPSAPANLGFLPLDNGAVDVAISGTTAWVALGSRPGLPSHGLAAVRVATPSAPSLLAFLDTGEPVHALSLAYPLLYLATGLPQSGDLLTVDISVPSAPALVGRIPLADAVQGLTVVGTTAHLAAGAVGLATVDVTEPWMPGRIDAWPSGRDTCAVAVGGDVTWVGERTTTRVGGLSAIDETAAPSGILATEPSGETNDVVAFPGLAFVLRGDGLNVVDTGDPHAPFAVGGWTSADANLTALAVSGTLAAVADGRTVRLLGLTDLAAPSEVGAVSVTAGIAVRPVLSDDRLYVVNGRGLDVFDVRSPGAPSLLGSYRTGGWSSALVIDGGLGYLANGTELHVLDLTDPAAMAPLAIVDFGESWYGVDVQGGIVALVGEHSYLATVDVSDPTAPELLARISGGPAFDVRLAGTSAYVAGDRFGVIVADIADPRFPSFLAFYDTSGSARAVDIDGSVVHAATGSAQHWLLECARCSASCSLGVVIQAETATVCAGTALPLSAVPTVLSGCPSGNLDHRWFEDGWPIPGAIGSVYTVPATHPPGEPTFMVEVTCVEDPSCTRRSAIGVTIAADTWPTIAANSLRVTGRPVDRLLSWQIATGNGETNVHRTDRKTELPDLARAPATIAGVATATTYSDTTAPGPGGLVLYRVFGRSRCTGQSMEP